MQKIQKQKKKKKKKNRHKTQRYPSLNNVPTARGNCMPESKGVFSALIFSFFILYLKYNMIVGLPVHVLLMLTGKLETVAVNPSRHEQL